MPNVIDLYAGAGGLSLGAARAGFDVVAAVELDDHAIATHAENFPNTVHIKKDILSLNGDELLQLAQIDRDALTGIIGGPPCQGFSSIGHGNVDDDRNRLFVKFFQLVASLQPSFYLAENVPGIMNEKYAAIRSEAFAHVANYINLPPIEIIASEYGAPTTRARTFFIGYLNDGAVEPFTEGDIIQMKVAENEKTNVEKALEGLPSVIRYTAKFTDVKKVSHEYHTAENPHAQSQFYYERVTGLRPEGVGNPEYYTAYSLNGSVNGCIPTQHSDEVKRRFSRLAQGKRDAVSKSTRLDPAKYCPTLRAGTGPEKGSYQAVRPVHYKYSRVITPREAARFQGFPDWFKLPNTIWHGFRQIGNSVSPIAAERVLTAIYQKLTR